jgi:predicted glycosyltransferase involved in capsule biosynthesis
MTTFIEKNSQKFRLPNLSIILHYRRDCDDREFNLKTTLKFLKSNFVVSDIVVIVDEKIHSRENYPKWIEEYAKVILVENDDEFKKSYSYNVGANSTNGDVLCFWDVDVLIEAVCISTSYDSISVWKTHDHVYPYDGTFVDVKKNYFCEFLDNYDFDKLKNELQSFDLGYFNGNVHVISTNSPGGCNLISREAFNRIGGYDERFVGWGFEDTDFRDRSMKINRVKYQSDNVLWHLEHTTHNDQDRSKQPHYLNNMNTYMKNIMK